MDVNLTQVKTEVYSTCALEMTDFRLEPESKEYDACRYKLSGLTVISRSAKTTPTKIGQFVTFWKRKANGPIEPFQESDPVDF